MLKNAKSEAGFYIVALDQLPELSGWLEQQELKSYMLEETGGGDSFIDKASVVVLNSIIGISSFAQDGSDRSMLKRLLYHGFTHQEIARAFSEAWLNNHDSIRLRKHSLADSRLLLYGGPLLVVGIVTTIGMLVIFDAHHDWLGSFIYIAPLFLVVLLPVIWLLVRAWRVVLERL